MATCALACVVASCRPRSQIVYTVGLANPATGVLDVSLEISGAPRDSLRLRTYGSPAWMRLADVAAFDGSGGALPVLTSAESVATSGDRIDVGHFTVSTRRNSSLRVRYSVRPGHREGDEHLGFTGRSWGHVGPDFALFTGRSVFLVPEGLDLASSIRVRLRPPPGWRAVSTWRDPDGAWWPAIREGHAVEHLVAGTVAMGRFRSVDVSIGGTLYRYEVERTVAAAESARAVTGLVQVSRWLRERFGRDLGDRYVTIVVPESPHGDAVQGESWASGQGRTLAPATESRLREYARDLVRAYLVFPTHRAEIRDRADYWWIDGVADWCARHAVARVFGVDRDELLRQWSLGYMQAHLIRGVHPDLERVYEGRSDGSGPARRAIAPFLVAIVDEELRAQSGGRDSLDRHLAAMFPKGRVRSVWSRLPGGMSRWGEFRARHARGNAPILPSRYFDLEATRPAPAEAPSRVVRRLTLAYTGDTQGFLEHCGCKSSQSGGVARRATVLRRIRERDPAVLLLDAGNTLPRVEKISEPDPLSLAEQKLYLQTMALAGYRASAVGQNELALGLDRFRAVTSGARFPYLAANVSWRGTSLGPASIVVETSGLRVAVIGVLEPPSGNQSLEAFQRHGRELEFESPVEALQREIERVRHRADLIMAIGRLTPPTIRKVVRACPRLDVVISTEFEQPTELGRTLEPMVLRQDQPGFLGRTLILYTTQRNYGFHEARLELASNGRIAAAELLEHELSDRIADDPGTREVLSAFYRRVSRLEGVASGVRGPFAADSLRMSGEYAGAQACRSCHGPEYEQWMGTSHAAAFKTLLDLHRHYQPRCVSCHVVGYGARHGYQVGDPEEPLGNVQCEVCHGPGVQHARAPSRRNIRRAVDETVCLSCHTPEHSDRFVFEEKLPLVRHRSVSESDIEGRHASILEAAHDPQPRRSTGRVRRKP